MLRKSSSYPGRSGAGRGASPDPYNHSNAILRSTIPNNVYHRYASYNLRTIRYDHSSRFYQRGSKTSNLNPGTQQRGVSRRICLRRCREPKGNCVVRDGDKELRYLRGILLEGWEVVYGTLTKGFLTKILCISAGDWRGGLRGGCGALLRGNFGEIAV